MEFQDASASFKLRLVKLARSTRTIICGDERPKQLGPLFDGSRSQVITCFRRCPDDRRPLTVGGKGAM